MMVDYNARIQTLIHMIEADVVALVPGPNMVYFTGLHFHLSERPTIALVHQGGLAFIIPKLEMDKLNERPDLDAVSFAWSDDDGYAHSFEQAITTLGLTAQARLGVDGMTMRVFEWLALQQAGAKLNHAVDVGQDLLAIRSYKTGDEVVLLQQAIELSEEALRRTMTWVEPGMTEVQIAQKLIDEMNMLGAQGLAFDPLVLIGANSALPHGMSGSRQLGENDFLLIDFGAKIAGYPSDITRTFCLGTPTAQMSEIYDAVLRANQAALAIAAPGVSCHDVDKAARDVIEAAGYGKYFTHRTGHGLGLSGHELPNIAMNNHTLLEAGMVFTIEPGIYLPGVGGVRIEDNVLVLASGALSLTTYPREL